MTAAAELLTQKAQREAAKDGRLVGWGCGKCGHKSITPMYACVKDGSREIKTVDLPNEGEIVSYTIQKIAIEEFINDLPFAFVVVKLMDGTMVSGWLPDVARDSDLPLGTKVRVAPTYKPGVLFERA